MIRFSKKLIPLADQAVSSATNFGCSALAAGLLSANGFGAYSIAVAMFILLLGISRTWTSDVVMILGPATSAQAGTEQSRGAMSASLGLGVLLGGGLALMSATLLHGETRSGLIALAICLPGIFLQDAGRYCAIVRGRAQTALRSDAVWLVTAVSVLVVLRRTDTRSVPLAVLSWGLAAVPGAVMLKRDLNVRLDLSAGTAWLLSCKGYSLRILGEYVVATASGFAVLLIITASATDLAAAGALRAAQTLLGPLTVLFTGSTLLFMPHMVQRHQTGREIKSTARTMTLLNTIASVVWIAALTAVPTRVAVRVFGESWAGAREILILVGAAFLTIALASGPLNAIRSRRQLSMGLAVQSTIGAIVLTATLIGVRSGGDHGALTGFVIGNVAAPFIAWGAFLHNRVKARLNDRPREAADGVI